MGSPVLVTGLPISAPTQRERVAGIIMHLLGMSGIPIVGPLVMWIINKDQSRYLDQQGRELLNFHLSFMAYVAVCLFSRAILPDALALVGVLLVVGLAFVGFFLGVTGVLHAWVGRVWRFPLTIRLL